MVDQVFESSKVLDDSVAGVEGVGAEGLEAIKALLHSQHGKGEASRIGVTFENLSVSAVAGTEVPVKTLPRAVLNTFGPDQYNFIRTHILNRFLGSKQSHNARALLSGFTGIAKPGELVLVLGRPGSGCSTFLRTIANVSTLSQTGDVQYAGVPAPDFRHKHPRETIYLPEEDRHVASLSVRQAITFALRTCLPTGSRDPALVANLVDAIARLFGLKHALDTPAGGAFSPGISGGERKRYVFQS
jgi:ABC-type transport system involved in cytochrome c biogenesis ATPase subunit